MKSSKTTKAPAAPPKWAADPESGLTYASAWALDSTSFAWDNRWGQPLEAAAVSAFGGDGVRQPPTADVFGQCRRWWRVNQYVRRMCALRQAFQNYGLLGEKRYSDGGAGQRVEYHPGIVAERAKDADKLNAWKAEQRQEIARVVQEVWHSWLICRNVVALWRKRGRVIIRPPETCVFQDEFGVEQLIIKHGLTETQINAMPGLSAAERARLRSKPELVLTHDDPIFDFAVLKEEPLGCGFGWPDLATVFHACSLEESLVVGDRQLADACRLVYEHHLCGHEIKSGNHAGSPAHFCKEKRATAVRKEIEAKKGHIQMVTNFDHKIVIGDGRPGPEQYETKRYARVGEVLATWGAPYAQMYLGGQINPFLMTLARTGAEAERELLRPFLKQVLEVALHAPVPVTVNWSNHCFWDSRLLLDLLKTGLAGGPMSQENWLRYVGFDPTTERSAKARDNQLPEAMLKPAYDAAHGPPNAPGKEKGGKPAGKADAA